MTASSLPTILKTRLLVGFLGERVQNAWWPTSFYDESSRLFLAPVFSRTFRLAQYHGVLEAARRLHDEHLSAGSFHLFRLHEEVEQDLHKLIQRLEADDFVLQEMGSKEAAVKTLGSLAGGITINSVGPTAIGSIRHLDSADTLKTIAATYLSAFNQNARTYPYLVA